MRKIILQEFVTLDGMAAANDGTTDFIPGTFRNSESFKPEQERLIASANTMLLGRKTYEFFRDYWPAVKEGGEKEFPGRAGNRTQNHYLKLPWAGRLPGRFDRRRHGTAAQISF